MRKLGKPTLDPIKVFETCISTVADDILKTKLESCKDLIIEAVKDYEEKAIDTKLHTVLTQTEINGEELIANEMVKVYTNRMVPKDMPGREIYDELLMSAPYDICPLCYHRPADTLDHHLPKKKYPIYSVVPINLFPCCLPCNKSKSTVFSDKEEEEPIHPYFDNVEDDLWLKAELIETDNPSLRFFTIKPENWSDIKYNRVKNHFETLDLSKLYASQSGRELSLIYLRVHSLFNTGGWESVKSHLKESYDSCNYANINSWQTAFYFALLNSEWYQKGGFDI